MEMGMVGGYWRWCTWLQMSIFVEMVNPCQFLSSISLTDWVCCNLFCGTSFCLFTISKVMNKSWKKQKCPFPLSCKNAGSVPSATYQHPRELTAGQRRTASTYNLTDLTAERLRGKTRRSPEIRHGDSSQLFSCFTGFIAWFGWIAWSRKKHIMIQRLYLTKRHENRTVTQPEQNSVRCEWILQACKSKSFCLLHKLRPLSYCKSLVKSYVKP